MEFFVYFLFFLSFTLLMAVLAYYANLLFFKKKEIYHRAEITQVLEPALKVVYEMLDSKGNIGAGVGLYLGFALFAYLFSLLGGIVGSPHYAGSWGNYFFHSPLLFFLFLFSFPFLEEAYGRSTLRFFFKSGRAVLSALGIGSISASFTSWGLYHEFSFFFCFFTLLLFFPLAYFWNSQVFWGIRIGPVPSVEPDWEETPGFPEAPAQDFSEDLETPAETADDETLEWDDFEPTQTASDKDPW